ncbi:MAG: MFS transporter [Bacteroidetes bacterium]|nr:MFS transporter [Bacteroidota bacterium]
MQEIILDDDVVNLSKDNLTPNPKNVKKVTNAWCMYDWANSVFPLTITSAIFPIYWSSQTPKNVEILGTILEHSTLYNYCLSFAFLIIALINPILSGIADSAGNKKSFMAAFVVIGCIGCFGLSFFDSQHIGIGVLAFIIGTIGYAGSIVFYNAYLPEIATNDQYDRISAKGFSMGYIGAVILLVLNLLIILKPEILFDVQSKVDSILQEQIGLSEKLALKQAKAFYAGSASRLAFFTVGIWWLGFSMIPFYYLPKNRLKNSTISITKGYHELMKVFKQVRNSGAIKKYLGAFFFISMGVQTVMYVAGLFGVEELKLPSENLIATILIIQLVAVLGAYLFSLFSKKFGNINALLTLVGIWILVCFAAFFVYSVNEFYALAGAVGMIMGGVQSLARSTYAKIIPQNTLDTASYFSFYEFTEKVAIVIGTFSFGFINQIMHSMRYSIVSLVVFFVVGFIFLLSCRVKARV